MASGRVPNTTKSFAMPSYPSPRIPYSLRLTEL